MLFFVASSLADRYRLHGPIALPCVVKSPATLSLCIRFLVRGRLALYLSGAYYRLVTLLYRSSTGKKSLTVR
jgi:hypothetical protein